MLDGMDSDKSGERLKKLRIAAGYRSATAFAHQHGLNATTYCHHENRRRHMSQDSAAVYARILQTSVGHLLYGEELHVVARVPIVGQILAEGYVQHMLDETGDEPEKQKKHPQERQKRQPSASVAVPNSDDYEALAVVGRTMYPALNDGDLVLHRKMIPQKTIDNQLHGVECVVRLETGEILIRTITIQRDGLATLIGYSVPPMFNQRVAAAAPVEWIKRAVR